MPHTQTGAGPAAAMMRGGAGAGGVGGMHQQSLEVRKKPGVCTCVTCFLLAAGSPHHPPIHSSTHSIHPTTGSVHDGGVRADPAAAVPRGGGHPERRAAEVPAEPRGALAAGLLLLPHAGGSIEPSEGQAPFVPSLPCRRSTNQAAIPIPIFDRLKIKYTGLPRRRRHVRGAPGGVPGRGGVPRVPGAGAVQGRLLPRGHARRRPRRVPALRPPHAAAPGGCGWGWMDERGLALPAAWTT
jgi:hypothetical protein